VGDDLQTLFKCLAISFSTMTLFTGIVPLYGRSLLYAGPVGMVWGWVVVTFFTWFVGFAMAEICSSFPVRPTHDSSPPADHVPPLFAILAFYAGFEPALGMQFCVGVNYYFLTHFHGRQQDPSTSGQLIWLGLDGDHWRPGSVHGSG
jgi:hypothetical protein